MYDVYERFALSLEGIGLKFRKRDHPQLLSVVETCDVKLLIKLKSKLKSMLRRDQAEADIGRPEPGAGGSAAEAGHEVLPEVEVTSLDGQALPPLTINLTPDSYNALVNIASVLAPEKTKAEVTSQFREKQSLLRSSTFHRVLPTLGVREARLSASW